jgi:NAD-dependent SIR2 family protein deacetylase
MKRKRGREADLHSLANLLLEGRRVVVVTGAGLSAASGIPTFRGSTTSTWHLTCSQKARRSVFLKNPRQWYNSFWLPSFPHSYLCCHKANEGHEAIAFLAHQFPGVRIITQNIDGLHFATRTTPCHAGNLIECHGRLGRYKCLNASCSFAYAKVIELIDLPSEMAELLGSEHVEKGPPVLASPPLCPGCQQPASPLSLLFDEGYESHSAYRFDEAMDWISSADALVFVGTSHAVTIGSLALKEARRRSMPVFDFNLEVLLRPSAGLQVATIKGKCEEALPELLALVALLQGPVECMRAYSLDPILWEPLTPNCVRVSLSCEHNRKVHPSQDMEQSIESTWEEKSRQQPSIFNALKFRLSSWERELSSDDASGSSNLRLVLGMTDYKSFLGTHWGPQASRFVHDGCNSKYRDPTVYLSQKLGVGCVLETSDGYIVMLKRSKAVAEGQGRVDGPGGHPEPSRLGIGDVYLTIDELTIKHEVNLEQRVVAEIFDSIANEIRDEVNVPLACLSLPALLMGIVRQNNSHGTPSAGFYVKTLLSADKVREQYALGATEAFESTGLVFFRVEDIVPDEVSSGKCFSDQGLTPTPSLQGYLELWRQHRGNGFLL